MFFAKDSYYKRNSSGKGKTDTDLFLEVLNASINEEDKEKDKEFEAKQKEIEETLREVDSTINNLKETTRLSRKKTSQI